MKLMVDASDYQAGLALDAVASAVDGAWFKAGDWAWVSRHGWPGDDVHDAALARFAQLGKPVGTYFFVRPGSTSPATQIDAWAQHAPKGLSIVPMIDLEATVISGASLRDWITEALELTAARFGAQPVLYWSNTFASAHGMTAPGAAHTPMVAEYHYGYRTFGWADRANWPATAYRAFGGPDVPPGYGAVRPTDLIWQFTSSGEIPGMPGLVDCDLVPDAAWSLITDATLPPASADDLEALMANDPTLAADLREFLRVFATPGGPHYLADVWNRSAADHPMTEALYHHVTDGNRLLTMAAQLANTQTTAWAIKWAAGNMDPVAGTEGQTIGSRVQRIEEAVAKLSTGNVDVDKLVADLLAAFLAVLSRTTPATTALTAASLVTLDVPATEPTELERQKTAKVVPGAEPTQEELAAAAARRLDADMKRDHA